MGEKGIKDASGAPCLLKSSGAPKGHVSRKTPGQGKNSGKLTPKSGTPKGHVIKLIPVLRNEKGETAEEFDRRKKEEGKRKRDEWQESLTNFKRNWIDRWTQGHSREGGKWNNP